VPAPPLGEGERLKPDSDEYKQHVFDRIKKQLRYKEGMRVRLHGSKTCGTVTKIWYTFDDVIWINQTPHFIEVTHDDGETCYSYSIRQLTTKKVPPK
jgi:hypothetical protein